MIRFETIAPPAPRRACRTVLVERMAEDIREMAFAGETVSAETLKLRGWSDSTVEALAPEARDRARRLSIRQIREA